MDQVHSTLGRAAYIPAYAEKMASYGIPVDEETLPQLLDITRTLKEAAVHSRQNVIKEAAASLGLQSSAHRANVNAASETQNFFDKRAQLAGAELAQIPEVRQALAQLHAK